MNDCVHVIVLNEHRARITFKKYKERLKFIPIDYYFIQCSEDKCIFSHAIAKFQHLVRFEE